jgi:DNA-binding MarR family transcriptional regulator
MASPTPTVTGVLFGARTLAGYAAWRDAMRWQRTVDRVVRPLGLTHTRLLVLHSVVRACRQKDQDEGATQVAIAKEAGLDPMTTSTVVRTLENAGLLSRDIGFGDRNAWRVLLTGRGKRLLASAAAAVEATLEGNEPARAPTPPRRARRRSSRAASG